ncbi:uncharacterized protein [Apostichopus japonicus]|uniref:uncharacterized protein isoform X2 n=1 Tax=Stichopus japonicus TaxID=307972 RepID=UPI003AB1D41C
MSRSLLLTVLYCVFTLGLAVPAAHDWVVRADRRPLKEHEKFSRQRRQVNDGLGSGVDVRLFHVNSQIAVRFAVVTVTCHIVNSAPLPQNYVYELILPPDAYISNFTLIVDDQVYTGEAEDQCFLDDPFTFSSVGATTGRLTASSLTRNLFQIKLNMAPRSQATFIVEYQEVLTRVGGWFTQVISIRPEQTVQDFMITASVVEPQGISSIEAALDTRTTSSSVIAAAFAGYVALPKSFARSTDEFTSLSNELTNIKRNSAAFSYEPSTIAQDRYPGNKGIYGDFILRYDVRHSYDVGYVLVKPVLVDFGSMSTGDVFVHYFSPTGYRPIKKNVAFVIDVSGSMYGLKLAQTKEALMTILDEVRITDTFNILPFSDNVAQWRIGQMVRATRRAVRDAKQFVAGLTSLKATNINSALLEGLDLLEQTGSMEVDENDPSICILFLLTDGKPTGEVTSVRQIENNCKRKNRNRCSIVTLGFGADVDFNFLARLALQNKGVARKIYADASAAGQLTGVYDEVATPLLYDISVDYLSNVDPSSVSSTTFPAYFNGSEISITGRLIDSTSQILPIRINAYGADGQFIIEEDVNLGQQFSSSLSGGDVPDDFPERTWAFLTLSELFKRFALADDADERRVLIDRSLELSERYNLLTPLMSLALLDSNGNRVTLGSDPDPQSGGNRGGGRLSSNGGSAPQGYGWNIAGPSFGTRGDSDTYGIGGAECTSPEPTIPSLPMEESFIDLFRMHISSKISERYAQTEVEAHIANRGTQPEPMEFSYQIPNAAFISDFSVRIDGVEYRGVVQDRRDSRWNSAFARSQSGNTIGLQTRRDPSKNMLYLRIPSSQPGQTVIFKLVYDELLQRSQNQYRHAVNIWPGEIVEDLTVDMYVTEPQGISEIQTQYEGRNSISPQSIDADINRPGNNRAQVSYNPTEDEQLNFSPLGLAGDIVLTYDVEHDRAGSHTQAQDGYFVHFFSPANIPQAPKHIVFVIDVSASMYGIKLRQVKDSLKIILDDLAANDRFNIITFSDDVEFWRDTRLVPATLTNIRSAKAFVESLTDLDETNLNDALLAADRLLDTESRLVPQRDEVLSLMILLTDGKPSQGVVDKTQILQNVREAIAGEHFLYTLGYGQDVDFDLLIQLALQNNGFARKIYETGAVNRELRDVYFEVSRPLLFDIIMEYEEGILQDDTLTRHQFPIYFSGSELVVASKVSPTTTATRLQGTVEANTDTGELSRTTTTDLTSTHRDLQRTTAVQNVVEKIWAVKTLEALIDEYSVTQNEERKRAIADAVVEIAQAYNLETPLTPLALYDPTTGSLLTGLTRDPVPLPTVSHAESSLSRMGDAIKYDPLPSSHSPQRPNTPDTPPGIDSSSGIIIDRLHAISLLALRFASTRIEQEMVNQASRAGQAVFKQKIPANAFITGISIMVDGKEYDGQVEDLLATEDLNLGSLEIGQSGGIVTPLDHESKMVILSIPLQPDQRAQFNLDYQMLIPRRRGNYEHKVSLFPEQIVDDILVDTAIVEPQGIAVASAYLNDKALDGNPQDLSYLIDQSSNRRWQVQYRPSTRRQLALSSDGIAGDFVLRYDTVHNYDAGVIQIKNNYFVQHFSPSGLAVLRKNVVFVIDISDSMAGAKLQQVKDALKTILDDMRPNDKFNILPFHSQVEFLDRYKMVEASRANIITAKRFVDDLVEQEATNLNKAIIDGVNQLRQEEERNRGEEKVVSMLIVLTDGEPTYGEKDEAQIERNVREVIDGDYSLFALGFGEDVDFPFLTRLALQNHGVARKIPATADASLLLEGFYEEVASPLLYDIEFRYSDGIEPQSLSEISFANYFNGSELVVVGKLLESIRESVLESTVYSKTATENLRLTSTGSIRGTPVELLSPDIPDDLLANIWAYHMIQGFLQTKEQREDNPVYTSLLDQDIIDFSLDHQFFNPFTAYIVNDPMANQNVGNRQVAMRIVEGELAALTQETLRRKFGTGALELTYVDETRNTESAVDDDPHFLVYLPKSDLRVCFDISVQEGSVLSLLQDPKRGLYVNGKIVGAPSLDGTGDRTYIGEVAMLWWFSPRKLPFQILFTPDNVTVMNNHVMHWGKQIRLKHKGVKLHINGKFAQVTLQHNVTFTVMRHKTPPKNRAFKPDYLGFFLEHSKGLSDGAHGLIGQFKTVKADLRPRESEPGRTADLIIKGRKVHVKEGSRNHSLQMKKHTCWKVENNGAGLIDGHYTDYLLSDIFGTD